MLTSIPKIAHGKNMPKYTVTIKLMKFTQDNAIVIYPETNTKEEDVTSSRNFSES